MALFLSVPAAAATPTPPPEPGVQPGPESEPESEPELEVQSAVQNIVAVTAGLSHTCALNSGGGVQCWGGNSFGQLGTNRVPLGRPILSRNVTDLSSGVKAIAAGDEHTCAHDRRLGEVLGFKRLWPGRRGRQCAQLTPIT